MESGVDFVAVDMPTANRLTIDIMAAFAEHVLGNPNITEARIAAAKKLRTHA